MLHVTHKDCLKLVGVAVIALVLFVGATFSSVVSAKYGDLSITAFNAMPVTEPDLSISFEVKKSVTCFVFARELKLGQDTLNIYLHRIGKASATFGAVYQLGLDTGMLAAYGYANAGKLGSVKAARLDAATRLYSLYGCTANESI